MPLPLTSTLMPITFTGGWPATYRCISDLVIVIRINELGNQKVICTAKAAARQNILEVIFGSLKVNALNAQIVISDAHLGLT